MTFASLLRSGEEGTEREEEREWIAIGDSSEARECTERGRGGAFPDKV